MTGSVQLQPQGNKLASLSANCVSLDSLPAEAQKLQNMDNGSHLSDMLILSSCCMKASALQIMTS